MTPKRLIPVASIFFVVLTGATFLRPLAQTLPPDFMQFYFAGKLVVRGQIARLYQVEAYQPLEAELRSQGESIVACHYFNRPAFDAILWAPFAWLSYRTAAWLMVAANLLLLGLLVWKLPTWFGASLGVRECLACFMPFLWSVGIGQDTLLLALIVAYGIRLAMAGKEARAGAILALGMVKPHLIWLVPIALVAERKWRSVWAFLAVSAALATVSFAAVGTAGVYDWISLLRSPWSDPQPENMGNVRALALHFGAAAGAVAAVLAVVSLGVALRLGSFSEKLASALLAALLLSPHTYWQDYSLAAVAATLLAARPVARYALLLPWPYFYPRKDMLPLLLVLLGYLAAIAVKLVRQSRSGALRPAENPSRAPQSVQLRTAGPPE